MARKPRTLPDIPAARKTRTREHVIASQSVVHVEKFIVAAGHTVERFLNDYGYDLNVFTRELNGEMEPGNIFIQIKATENLPLLQDGETISFPMEWRDIALWRKEPMPIILIVYDALQEAAYWLYVQEMLEKSAELLVSGRSGHVNFHLSKNNVLNEQAVERFRDFKNIVLSQTEMVKHHG